MAKIRAVSYVRVSGKGQIDGDGFDRQQDAIKRFAKSAGYEIVAEYRDEGCRALATSKAALLLQHYSTASSTTASRS